jgi:hypothetical protein
MALESLRGKAEIVWQVTSCDVIFKNGFVPRIHGKITTSPENRGIAGLGCGLLMAPYSRHGKTPDRARSSGSMVNVSTVQHVLFPRDS